MAAETKKEIELEIAYVLFIDIVGYSKLSVNEQHSAVEELNQIVRASEQFQKAEAASRLLKIPTGDGMALVFYTSPEAPAQCAVEISRALKEHSRLQLRMGIHSGPVSGVVDVNERANVAGAGLNVAQRVMDCGDAGHILLSKHAAEDLGEYRQWQLQLHDLGECDIKHGGRLHVVNLYTGEVGNPRVPTKFRQAVEKRRLALIVMLTLLAAAAGAGYYFFSQRPAFKTPDKSIAVLPFENLSRDPDNAYFTEGVQEEILTRLAKISDLKVISRTSTQHFKSSPDNLPQIAKQLGVANILEGSVQKVADQVRVSVQLINATTDAHLWAESFDRQLTDIFRMESEIAKTIADTLQAKLTGSEKQAIAAQPTENSEAHESYLKGRFFWNKRTANDFKTAISYFQKAIDKDPNYALAYAGLADSYTLLSAYGAASPEESFPPAKTAAKKALTLDDTLAEAHASLAKIVWGYDLDFDGSINEFRRAIELNPNYATAHRWFSDGPLTGMGRFDEAIAEGKRAIELDPLSLINNATLGDTYFLARRYDEAIEQERKTLEMDPGFYFAHWNLGEAFEAKGALEAAIEEYQKARALNDDPLVLGLLGHAYASSGKKTDALKILEELKVLSKQRYVSAYSIALVYLGLGDKEQALRWLEKSYQDRAGFEIAYIKVDPFLDPLRGDPRFEALVAKVFAPKNGSSP